MYDMPCDYTEVEERILQRRKPYGLMAWENYSRVLVLSMIAIFVITVGGIVVMTQHAAGGFAFSGLNMMHSASRPRWPQPPPVRDRAVVCYYNLPSELEAHHLLPSAVHPYLCTHINAAFARVENKVVTLDKAQYHALVELRKLKHINPKLKILLSVGGAGGDGGFSDMVIDHASRKIFIKSIKELLSNYSLDGIDLDWEFPAFHSVEANVSKRERQHFSQLLREIRVEYVREKRDYLLTVAVAAQESIVDLAYDIDQFNMYVDFVNVMSYDYHFYTKFTPFTGLNSPLYARATEQMYLATLNINYTVNMYLSKGLEKGKLVVGIPTYGHTFNLVNSGNSAIGSPASGYGSLGYLGFVNYPDVCTYLKNYSDHVNIVVDKAAQVPYLYRNYEWVSYDTPQSVMKKAKYIKDQGLLGAMIYSLNSDDYDGICTGALGNNIKFPLAQSIKSVLITINNA